MIAAAGAWVHLGLALRSTRPNEGVPFDPHVAEANGSVRTRKLPGLPYAWRG